MHAVIARDDGLEPLPGADDKFGDLLDYRLYAGIGVLSQGRVIVADRLHAVILATLMEKPHVYLDNSYKKIANVRTSAFGKYPECSEENLRAAAAHSLEESIVKAMEMLST